MAIRTAVNRALTAITALPTAAALVDGNLTLLTTLTASSSANLTFNSSIDSTYDSYLFKFINIHPATDAAFFTFQANAVGGSDFNETITSTMFTAYHEEDGSDEGLAYVTSGDQANGTAFQQIARGTRNEADDNCSGSLTLFNPSSTTFVKHYIASANTVGTA